MKLPCACRFERGTGDGCAAEASSSSSTTPDWSCDCPLAHTLTNGLITFAENLEETADAVVGDGVGSQPSTASQKMVRKAMISFLDDPKASGLNVDQLTIRARHDYVLSSRDFDQQGDN